VGSVGGFDYYLGVIFDGVEVHRHQCSAPLAPTPCPASRLTSRRFPRLLTARKLPGRAAVPPGGRGGRLLGAPRVDGLAGPDPSPAAHTSEECAPARATATQIIVYSKEKKEEEEMPSRSE